MKAIVTMKQRNYRYRASDGDHVVIIPESDQGELQQFFVTTPAGDEWQHGLAMQALCKKLKWHGYLMPGHLKNGRMVWVWLNEYSKGCWHV